MISHGDEIGRTQHGNNNAYCHDTELSWLDWDLDDERRMLLAFTKLLIRFRLSQPTLRRRRYFQGRSIRGGDVKDLAWIAPNGREMNDSAWNADFVRSIGMLLSGSAIEETDERGAPILGDTLLVLLNAHSGRVPFTLPPLEGDIRWHRLLDTFDPHLVGATFRAGSRYPLQGRSVAALKIVAAVRERRRVDRRERAADPEPAEIEA
jgi:glycogen operon protein